MILLTGCSSYLGRQLLDKLLERGEIVRCYDLYKPKDLPEDVEFIQGDLLGDAKLKKLCTGIDTIFHFMDIRRPGYQGRKSMKKINVRGTQNLLLAAERNNVKKFFFLSTYEVYGKPKGALIRQDDRKKPGNSYGKDKLKGENFCWEYEKKGKMAITIFRPSPIAGPNIDDPIILITLYMVLAMGDASVLYMSGDGDTKYQLLHPEDALNAFLAAYDSDISRSKVYNLGSNNVPTQMEQIVKVKEKAKLGCTVKHISPLKARLLSLLFKPLKLSYLSKEHLVYLLNNILLDCQRAKKDLGWDPKKDNINILLETIEWYKQEKI
ncbi:MAG: NAD(P)-dependent oxidoreductase [bacterium]|nr:NAD(P)-dependent oxidoreductase [bacterium]